MHVIAWIYVSLAVIALTISGVILFSTQSILTVQIASGVLWVALLLNAGYLVFLSLERKRLLRTIDETSQLHFATQLPNRQASLHSLHGLIKSATRHGHAMGVMIIDIDDFKEINDRFGLSGGDIILKQVAEAIRAECRESDLVGHFTGDRFLVASPHSNQEGTLALARRIHRTLTLGKFASKGGQTNISASIGVAASPPQQMDGDELVRSAGAALRAAKKQGKSRIMCETDVVR